MNDVGSWLRHAMLYEIRKHNGDLALVNQPENLEFLLRRSIEIVNERKGKQMEKCVATENNQVFHKSCFMKQYPEERRPEYRNYDPQDDDECDNCAGLLLDPPDEDDFEDDDPDDEE